MRLTPRLVRIVLALPLLLVVGLGLHGCGDADPQALVNDGMKAMNGGDAKAALVAFDDALKSLKPGDADYMRAAVSRCQALARVDPARGQADFLALAKANPKDVKDQDFHVVVSEFVRQRKFTDAITIMHEGNTLFSGSKKMEEITKAVVAESQKAQDEAAIAALKGLGYISK